MCQWFLCPISCHFLSKQVQPEWRTMENHGVLHPLHQLLCDGCLSPLLHAESTGPIQCQGVFRFIQRHPHDQLVRSSGQKGMGWDGMGLRFRHPVMIWEARKIHQMSPVSKIIKDQVMHLHVPLFCSPAWLILGQSWGPPKMIQSRMA